MSSRAVELVRGVGGGVVAASLLDGMQPADLVLVEREWGPERARLMAELLGQDVPRPEWPESLHWDWRRKAQELRLLAATGFGIRCEDRWQGVMLTKTAGHVTRLTEGRGKPLVYIDYLEAAPWNWRVEAVGQVPPFRGVGSLLFHEAVVQSVEEGFHGRLGLHALPQAEGFYERVCGMSRVGADAAKQHLVYFEFSRDQAKQFLEEGGAP